MVLETALSSGQPEERAEGCRGWASGSLPPRDSHKPIPVLHFASPAQLTGLHLL